MRFGILGPLWAEHPDGTGVPLGGPRLRALLAMLLLDAGRPVSVDRLIDGLYGERPPAGAGNALQSQVSRLRQLLPVEREPAGYRLAVSPGEVDAHRFAALAADGHRALADGEPDRAVTLLREAVALWRGDALADVRDAPFAAGPVTRLTELRLTAVEDLHDALLTGERPSPTAITELRGLIAAHPLRERLRSLLIRSLTAAGHTAEALSAYEDARRILADELGADPGPELTALHAALLGPSSRVTPEPGGHAPARHGVPSQLTSFVGRDGELARVAAALRTGRLVTLHGPGGAGKTRLAAEVAARHDGDVYFAELAAAAPGDVAGTLLTALGVRDPARRDAGRPPGAPERLAAALAGRRLLLVLDNCEHVVDEAAALAGHLLPRAPELWILATSREPLGLTGEVLHPVGGLPVPPVDPSAGPDAVPPERPSADLDSFPSVRLFADRAADVSPGFRVTAANAAAVRRICRTLDGLPLAVELAAARLHALSAGEVAARLDDRFRLLSRAGRGATARHRTLQAVVDWSWDLLTEPERRLARRFAAFAGSATLDAVERVCGPLPDIVDLLAGLVSKSLIERDGDRYRMLETIREYCAGRLDEAGERDRMHRAHAAYFLDLADGAGPVLRTAGQLAALERLDADRDNLHTALRRSAAAGAPRTALRLVAALSFYWWLRGLRAEAATLAGLALDAAGPEPPPDLTEEYVMSVFTAALGGSGRPAGRWTAFMRTLTAAPRQPFLLYLSAMAVGPPDGGADDIVALNRYLRAQLSGDPWSEALGAIGGGWMVLFSGADPALAEPEFRASLAGFRALGERWGAMLALSGLAETAAWRGDPAAGTAWVAEALRLAGELGSTVDVADLIRGRAEARQAAGDRAGAAEDFTRSAELARRAGAPELTAAALLGLGVLALDRGDLPEAGRLCSAALATCPEGWYSAEGTRMAILLALGRVAEAAGDPGTAAARYREMFTVRGGMLGFQVMAEGLDRLAALALADGAPERAVHLLGAVRALALRPGPESSPLGAETAAAARAALGETRYAAAFAHGASLTPDQALALPHDGQPAGPPI
ncbi:BTAD domain-containing putative transcriptional regulator [Actinoplanes flavus]|uniref:Winged helix-turn-helix domain-containing protein n=1 Tax=Actinoplanes flavus TaxID=2820290 RepID=A0ABS3UJV9_9ACTN|nr:BTAD domain-containing putative transcriptional regulator [Actinoplanes flavus]MBO3739048.1 winged helix-turn-helix domain-containing protein [Actinoplanes flavus]